MVARVHASSVSNSRAAEAQRRQTACSAPSTLYQIEAPPGFAGVVRLTRLLRRFAVVAVEPPVAIGERLGVARSCRSMEAWRRPPRGQSPTTSATTALHDRDQLRPRVRLTMVISCSSPLIDGPWRRGGLRPPARLAALGSEVVDERQVSLGFADHIARAAGLNDARSRSFRRLWPSACDRACAPPLIRLSHTAHARH